MNKTNGVVNWSDNLEISDETEFSCKHEDIDCGQCLECGKTSEDLYEEIYK